MAAGVRLRRARRPPARAGWPRRCVRCRWCWTSPSGCAGPRPDAWIIDFTNPVGIVTRALLQAGHKAVGLCNVAIGFQRKFAAAAGRDAGPGAPGPRGAQPPDVGAGGAPRRPGRRGRAAQAAGRARRRDRRGPAHAARRSSTGSASCRRTTCATTTRTTRWCASCGTKPSRAAEVAAMEKQLLEMYGDPALDEKPELLVQARRRVLLGGGRRAGLLAAARHRRRAGGQHVQQRHAALPRRTTR